MAAINLPFAASATKRAPDTDELTNGFGCGPADKELFDWLTWWQTGQIANLVSKAGLTVDDTDLARAAKAMRSHGMNYRAAAGSANALTITLDPPVTDWSELLNVPLLIKATAANSSATVTLSADGLTAKPVKRLGGGALNPGDLQPGFFYEMVYDGTQLQVISTIAPPTGLSTTAAPRLIGFTALTAGQSYPTSTNTLMTLTMAQDNLVGTSTYASNTLTIGAGEAGVWLFEGFTQFTSGGAGLGFTSVSLRKNGAQVAIGGENAGAGLSSYDTFCKPIVADVGDTFQWFGFQQSGTTLSSASQSASAFLISAK